jgi:hypothetical protein
VIVLPSYSLLFSFAQAASASSLLLKRTVPKPLQTQQQQQVPQVQQGRARQHVANKMQLNAAAVPTTYSSIHSCQLRISQTIPLSPIISKSPFSEMTLMHRFSQLNSSPIFRKIYCNFVLALCRCCVGIPS